jgi:hypothetical protein
VTQGDAIGQSAGEGGLEDGQPQLAGGLLEVFGFRRKGCVVSGNGQAEAAGEVHNEGRVGIGFVAAQVMIHVQDAVRQIQFHEYMEETHGIGPAGDGDGDAPAEGEHRVAGNGGEDAIPQDTSYSRAIQRARCRALDGGRTVL